MLLHGILQFAKTRSFQPLSGSLLWISLPSLTTTRLLDKFKGSSQVLLTIQFRLLVPVSQRGENGQSSR